MRHALALVVALAAAPAAADTFVWTDASGEEHYTDDPSMVPPAARHTLRSLDVEGSTLSVVNPEPDGGLDPGAAAAERERLLLEQSERGKLEALRVELEQAVAALQRRIADADREARKYGAGGRIGAADAAARARELAAQLRGQLAGKEHELRALLARIGE